MCNFVIANDDYPNAVKHSIEQLLNKKQNLSVKYNQELLKKNNGAVDNVEENLQVTNICILFFGAAIKKYLSYF